MWAWSCSFTIHELHLRVTAKCCKSFFLALKTRFTLLQSFSCACKFYLRLQSYVHFHKSYHTHANLLGVKIPPYICQSQGMAFEEKNRLFGINITSASRKWAVQHSILQRLIFDVDFMYKCSVLVPSGALFCSQGSDGWALQPFQLYLWTIYFAHADICSGEKKKMGMTHDWRTYVIYNCAWADSMTYGEWCVLKEIVHHKMIIFFFIYSCQCNNSKNIIFSNYSW